MKIIHEAPVHVFLRQSWARALNLGQVAETGVEKRTPRLDMFPLACSPIPRPDSSIPEIPL